MKNQKRILRDFSLGLLHFKVDPNRMLPPGHYVGDGHDHGGGAGHSHGVEEHGEEGRHHDEPRLPSGHYAGDGHNHGAEGAQGHFEGDGHIHGAGGEHESAEERLRQGQQNQSAGQDRFSADRFARAEQQSASFRNPTASSGSTQSRPEGQAPRNAPTEARSNFSNGSGASMAQLMSGSFVSRGEPQNVAQNRPTASSFAASKNASTRQSGAPANAPKEGALPDGASPYVRNTQNGTQSGQKRESSLLNPERGTGIQTEADTALFEGHASTSAAATPSASPKTAGGQPTFISLLSGKTSNVFLQSLPPALRGALGFLVPSQFPQATVPMAVLAKMGLDLKSLMQLTPAAFAKALATLSLPANQKALLFQRMEMLGFQAYAPLTLTGLKFAFPSLLERAQKAIGQFSNLLFGNYLLETPVSECGEEDLLLQELGLLFMNDAHRKKAKKKETKKMKEKDDVFLSPSVAPADMEEEESEGAEEAAQEVPFLWNQWSARRSPESPFKKTRKEIL